jgi:hypothetical protein
MNMNALIGDAAEDPEILFSGMRNMLAQRRNDVHITVWRERVIKSFGYLAGAAVCARKIWRQQKHAAKLFADAASGFIEEAKRQRVHLGPRQFVCFAPKPRHCSPLAIKFKLEA